MTYTSDRWTALGRALTQRLAETGRDPAALVRESSLSRPTVEDLIRGEPKHAPKPATLWKLSRALDWTPDSIERILRGEEPLEASPFDRASREDRTEIINRRLDEIGAAQERQREMLDALQRDLARLLDGREPRGD